MKRTMTRKIQQPLSEPDRRRLLKRATAVFGAALFPPIASGLLAGCSARENSPANPQGASGKILSAPQYALVAEIAEIIIPQTDTPGAKAAGVAGFIDTILDGWFSEIELTEFLDGMSALETLCQSAYGAAFLECDESKQVAVLSQLDKALHEKSGETTVDLQAVHFFKLMKQFTLIGYYTSEPGASQELAAPTMGQYIGCETFDESGKAWAW